MTMYLRALLTNFTRRGTGPRKEWHVVGTGRFDQGNPSVEFPAKPEIYKQHLSADWLHHSTR